MGRWSRAVSRDLHDAKTYPCRLNRGNSFERGRHTLARDGRDGRKRTGLEFLRPAPRPLEITSVRMGRPRCRSPVRAQGMDLLAIGPEPRVQIERHGLIRCMSCIQQDPKSHSHQQYMRCIAHGHHNPSTWSPSTSPSALTFHQTTVVADREDPDQPPKRRRGRF
jgi:hypothetical protein